MNGPARHALELNNEAVQLMLAGEDKTAAKALAEALAVIKRLHPTSIPSSQEQDAGILLDQECVVFHENVVVPDVHDQMGSNFIYNQAFVFDAMSKPRQRETDLEEYSACFIFNLALIYHRAGVIQRSTRLLLKAEQAYEMAKKCVCGLRLNHRTALSVSMAATNNISLIQFDQGHFSEAREGLHLLACLIDSAENSRDLFNEKEWDGLHLNMLLLNPPGSAPAA
jgi:hypothetical protein